MIYTIAILEDLVEDIEIEFNKDGKGYTVIIIKKGDGIEIRKSYRRYFDNLKEAKEVFNKISDAILEGMYSFENRLNILFNKEII